jgi:hypothetical protein
VLTTDKFTFHREGSVSLPNIDRNIQLSTLTHTVITCEMFSSRKVGQRSFQNYFHSFDIIKVFYMPTDAQVNCLKNYFKIKLQFLPYGRSIGSWICLTHKTYTCHTLQNITDTHNIVLHNSQRYKLQKLSFVSYQGCVVHRWVSGVP